MTSTEVESQAAADGLARGYHNIPEDAKLQRMSFVELASLLSSCQSGSPIFNVVEREMKKHVAKDQAEINRPNMLWAAGIGGFFALSGVILGAYLNTSLLPKQVAPTTNVQQPNSVDCTLNPPKGNALAPYKSAKP